LSKVDLFNIKFWDCFDNMCKYIFRYFFKIISSFIYYSIFIYFIYEIFFSFFIIYLFYHLESCVNNTNNYFNINAFSFKETNKNIYGIINIEEFINEITINACKDLNKNSSEKIQLETEIYKIQFINIFLILFFLSYIIISILLKCQIIRFSFYLFIIIVITILILLILKIANFLIISSFSFSTNILDFFHFSFYYLFFLLLIFISSLISHYFFSYIHIFSII
jgi:hypothetical protein